VYPGSIREVLFQETELKIIIAAVVSVLSSATFAQAASCEANFKVSGVPIVTAVSFRSWQEFPKAKAPAVLKKLAKAVAAEGFYGISVNKERSSIDAHEVANGSGRIQTLRVVARQKGDGVRVDAVFNIHPGQVASKDVVRTGLCNIINAARG